MEVGKGRKGGCQGDPKVVWGWGWTGFGAGMEVGREGRRVKVDGTFVPGWPGECHAPNRKGKLGGKGDLGEDEEFFSRWQQSLRLLP